MKTLKIFCSLLFFLVLCIPITQQAFTILPKNRVEGVSLPKPPEQLSAARVLEGAFQAEFEKWFHKRNGLWEHFVRLDNQLNFSVFRQVASSYMSQVLLGDGITLFQRFYLDEYNRAMFLPDEVLQHRVTLLKQAQEAPAKRGIPMLLVLSANHLGVNPEILSPQFISPNRQNRPSIYERMLPMLDAAGIPYIDAMAFFKSELAAGRLHFTPSGSHWDAVGACLISQQILDRAEVLTGKKMADLKCDPTVDKPTPRREELDLVQIANFWDSTPYQIPTRYPLTSATFEEGTHKPNFLIVGTSFVDSLMRTFERRRVVRRADFFFYYREHRKLPHNKPRKLDTSKIDWTKLLENRDLVIIECSTALMHDAGFGFLTDVITKANAPA